MGWYAVGKAHGIVWGQNVDAPLVQDFLAECDELFATEQWDRLIEYVCPDDDICLSEDLTEQIPEMAGTPFTVGAYMEGLICGVKQASAKPVNTQEPG